MEKFILNEKSLKLLENISDNIEFDDIKIIKKGKNYTILKDNEEYFNRRFEEGVCELEGGYPDRIIESLYVLGGCYEVLDFLDIATNFEREDIIYYNNYIYQNGLDYILNKKGNQFSCKIFDNRILKIVYDINNDNVYISYHGKHDINLNEDIKTQVINILDNQDDNIKLIKKEIKNSIIKILKKRNLDIDEQEIFNSREYLILEDYLTKKLNDNYDNDSVEDIIFATANIKDNYLKFINYKNNEKSIINEEIVKLNNLLGNYYDQIKNNEYEKELNILKKELKKKYDIK